MNFQEELESCGENFRPSDNKIRQNFIENLKPPSLRELAKTETSNNMLLRENFEQLSDAVMRNEHAYRETELSKPSVSIGSK
jgi:hypothetical protein